MGGRSFKHRSQNRLLLCSGPGRALHFTPNERQVCTVVYEAHHDQAPFHTVIPLSSPLLHSLVFNIPRVFYSLCLECPSPYKGRVTSPASFNTCTYLNVTFSTRPPLTTLCTSGPCPLIPTPTLLVLFTEPYDPFFPLSLSLSNILFPKHTLC